MKYFIFLLLFINSIYAKESSQSITLGTGLYMQTQPYNNVDTLVLPSPVIFYDNGIAYIRWTRFGVYFMGEKSQNYSWGFSLTAQPRTYGYKSSDICGMREKKDSWEGGLAFSAKSGKSWLEITALTDILNSEKRWVVNTEIGYDFKLSKFSFYPSFVITYQSLAFNNYYYGVSKDEALSSSFQAYNVQAGVALALQTYIEYPLTKKLSSLINIKANQISQNSYQSPIVKDRYTYSSLLSLIYKFEY